MVNTIRTDSNNPDFIALVKELDAYLEEIDGKDHEFYAPFNKIDEVLNVVLAYEEGKPLGCGAIKEFANVTVEIKRMYVKPTDRRMGIASEIIEELERWTSELMYTSCILETGKKQEAAIALYLANGYKMIPNYGQYAGVANSVCFGKHLL